MMQKGRTYIIDNKPQQRISLSNNEMLYSKALVDVTYGNKVTPKIFIEKQHVGDFIDEVVKLRAQFSFEHSATIKDALSNKVLSDPLFVIENAKNAARLREFLERWEPYINDQFKDEAREYILKYIIQPQVSPTLYQVNNTTGDVMPGYKTNDFLVKTVFRWAENNGMSDFVKDLVINWEKAARGEFEINNESWDRTTLDRYDYSKSPIPNNLRSIAKHMNIHFASPILDMQLNGIDKLYQEKVIGVEGSHGEDIPIRRTNSKKKKWSDMQEEAGCR